MEVKDIVANLSPEDLELDVKVNGLTIKEHIELSLREEEELNGYNLEENVYKFFNMITLLAIPDECFYKE